MPRSYGDRSGRAEFLRAHIETVYDTLTDRLIRFAWADDLVRLAAMPELRFIAPM